PGAVTVFLSKHVTVKTAAGCLPRYPGGCTGTRQTGAVIRAVLLAFALALWSPATAADDRIAEATALSREALALYQDHRYAEAEPLFKRALAIVEKTLGPNHPLVASMLINLAERYREQNRYKEVEPLYLRALEIQQDALGPGHPELGKSLN